MSPSPPGKGLLGEKVIPPTQSPYSRHRKLERMPSARHIFLTLLLGLLVTAGLANAVLKQQPPPNDEDSAGNDADYSGDGIHRDDSTFSRLLSSASPQAIHEFLHAYFPGTYKHGIYDSDHSAMEAVHATDPELATSIVQMAKRQAGNETTVPPTSTQAPDSSTLSTSTLVQTTTTTTPDTSTTDTTTTSPTAPSETSTVVETITTTSSTDSPTTQPTSDSTSATSTPDSTPGTTTTSNSITSRATRTSTFTSTLPGGAKTTITSVEVVTPGAPEEASTTSGSSGSLQSGQAAPFARKPVVELVIGVVVGGALLA
ncbi:hypothetical protein F4821DRAFT_228317 [Hypoxylon rubiginosum]|uniref:Uncharacterized protein n=1 Tax=Hypoxylon rubiginosum TaxID=110542 RepID=A0ACC0DE56_9PEZI|nr:hypothetical protein F4821DRAFT_228317 [Hypoxylon rubiginosum]